MSSSKKILSDIDDKSEKAVLDLNVNINNNNTNSNLKEKNYEFLNINRPNEIQDSYGSSEFNKHEENTVKNRNNDNSSSDSTCDGFSKNNKKNLRNNVNSSNNISNLINTNTNNNTKIQNDNRYATPKCHTLSTILEDNEVISNINNHRKNSRNTFYASCEDTCSLNDKNNSLNNNINISNSNDKVNYKNTPKSESNSERLDDSLDNKINININNNININFNVNDINKVSEQFKSQSKASPSDFTDKMKNFTNRTMSCQRNIRIYLSNEELQISSSERNSQFGYKFYNSQSNNEINKSEHKNKLIKNLKKENNFNPDKKNINCEKFNNNQRITYFNNNDDMNDIKKKEKEALKICEPKTNEINQSNNAKKKIETMIADKKIENKIINNTNEIISITNKHDFTNNNYNNNNINNNNLNNNKIDTTMVKKDSDNKPKNDRANNFANFFQRLNKSSQPSHTNIPTNKLSEEVLKKPDPPKKLEINNPKSKINEEDSKKTVKVAEVKKVEEEELLIAKAQEKAFLSDCNVNNKSESSEELISNDHQQAERLQNNFPSLENCIGAVKDEAINHNKQEKNMTKDIKAIPNENITSNSAESKVFFSQSKIENKIEEIYEENENPKGKLETVNTEELFKITNKNQTDSLNQIFNQNEIHQKLKLEKKLSEKNTRQKPTSNNNSLSNIQMGSESVVKQEAEVKDEKDQQILKKINNQYSQENENPQTLIKKTNSKQSIDFLEPDKNDQIELLTSQDHVVSAEEELNRCFMIRRKEKYESNSQFGSLSGKLHLNVKDKLCSKQAKIKMFNLRTIKIPILNSSNSLKEQNNKNYFGLNCVSNLSNNRNQKHLKLASYKTTHQIAFVDKNRNISHLEKDDYLKKDSFQKEEVGGDIDFIYRLNFIFILSLYH